MAQKSQSKTKLRPVQTKRHLISGLKFQAMLDGKTCEFCEATGLKSVWFVYAKHYFLKICLCKCLFRLRETQLFKNSSLQALVSSTRNATLKKQVASRLRETLFFFENRALVYATHYFCSARLATLGAAVPLRRLTIKKTINALVYAKWHF